MFGGNIGKRMATRYQISEKNPTQGFIPVIKIKICNQLLLNVINIITDSKNVHFTEHTINILRFL